MRPDIKIQRRLKRKRSIRKRISGTQERPRMTVFKSNKHIYVQVIDDVAGATLVSASTKSKALRNQIQKTGSQEAASIVGEAVAKAALGVGIKCVSFDRGPYKYHGRCKALAEAARKTGLVF